MLNHKCHIDHMKIIGQRPNPLNGLWNEWTLVVCTKCKKLYEWQHYSEEQMHGGDLESTALVTPDYLHHVYKINVVDVDAILRGKKMIRRYDRHKMDYIEERA